MKSEQEIRKRHVPFTNARLQYLRWRDEIDAAVHGVLDSGNYDSGPVIEHFEKRFADYCGTRYAAAVHSGTAALLLTLLALGIGDGDEVITAPNSDLSTAAAVHHAGGRVVFVDLQPDSLNMDPDLLEKAITPKTRAVIPVHMYGRPAEMDPINEIAKRHDLPVIEDACLATGGAYRGRPAGSLARAGCFSFAPRKVMGALGFGGMVTTDDAGIDRMVRTLRGLGEDPGRLPPTKEHMRLTGLHFEHEGWNLRMDSLQAAMLTVKLSHLDEMVAERRQIAARYRQGLAGLPLDLPDDPGHMRHVYRIFVTLVHGDRRDELRAALYDAGVETATHYVPPLHQQPVYQHLGYGPGSLPVTDDAAARLMALPVYPGLSGADQDHIIAAVRELAPRYAG